MEQIWDKIAPYAAILGAFTAFLTTVAAVTPTKKDDQVVTWLDRIGKFADRFGIQFKKPL